MKKIILALSVASAFGMLAANAATTAGTGVINFKGEIVADTCVLSPNGHGTQIGSRDLTYSMGQVSVHTLGNEDTPNQALASAFDAVPVDVRLEVQCLQNYAGLELTLAPVTPSGKGVAISGTAKNVQIMLMENDAIVDFTTPYKKAITLVDGKAPLNYKAYYTIAASKAPADVVTGTADGSVSYVLTHN